MSQPNETLEDGEVTYTVEVDGRLIVVEHVPARICAETGEHFFSPQTVERIHAIIGSGREPTKILQTPVYDFAA